MSSRKRKEEDMHVFPGMRRKAGNPADGTPIKRPEMHIRELSLNCCEVDETKIKDSPLNHENSEESLKLGSTNSRSQMNTKDKAKPPHETPKSERRRSKKEEKIPVKQRYVAASKNTLKQAQEQNTNIKVRSATRENVEKRNIDKLHGIEEKKNGPANCEIRHEHNHNSTRNCNSSQRDFENIAKKSEDIISTPHETPKSERRRSKKEEKIPVEQRYVAASKNTLKQAQEQNTNIKVRSATRENVDKRNIDKLHGIEEKKNGPANCEIQHEHNHNSTRNCNSSRRYFENTAKKSEDIISTFHLNHVPYIDSHCHTDFMFNNLVRHANYKAHYGIQDWIQEYPKAFPKSCSGIIANFIKPDLFVDIGDSYEFDTDWIAKEIESNYYLGTTWGCHPNYAEKWAKKEGFWTTLEYFLENAFQWKVLAVGECGIDLNRCQSELELQKQVFDKHIALAYKYKLPLVIHCRNGTKGRAEEECLEVLKNQMSKNHPFLKIHRHCFMETWDVAKLWLKECPDVHFGFTSGIMLMNESQIDAVRRIPLDRILLETDGPFFKPKCFEGIAPHKVCFPGMAIATAKRIAEIKNLTVEEVLHSTYNNTKRLYQIPVY